MADGTFSQGRIRVNRYGAGEAREALESHLGFLLDARAAVHDIDEARSTLNARIQHTRRVLEELDRVYEERGWPHGELQRTHA